MSNIEALIEEIDSYDAKIHKLQSPIAKQVYDIQQMKTKAQEELTKAVFAESKDQLGDYGCGTANLETPQFKIKTVVSKKVKWDETELRKIANKIKSAGQDPEHWIKYKLSVSETDFKKWDDTVQAEFITARSVEPSAPVVTYERK